MTREFKKHIYMKLLEITFALDNIKEVITCKPNELIKKKLELFNLINKGYDIRILTTNNI